ncbi:hypothetical protein MRB53_028194 [Persea americana]|uniref:Uncharacterized protein n=1 Tax=Persea americana TaxID=3435 RepID=A0ACC2KEU1_PERAE|nr:hypothetical protein MRB53_028194 [Persea americana]
MEGGGVAGVMWFAGRSMNEDGEAGLWRLFVDATLLLVDAFSSFVDATLLFVGAFSSFVDATLLFVDATSVFSSFVDATLLFVDATSVFSSNIIFCICGIP